MGNSNDKEVTQKDIEPLLNKSVWFIYDPYETVYDYEKGRTEYRAPYFQIYDKFTNCSLYGTTSSCFTEKHTLTINNQTSSKTINKCGILRSLTVYKKTNNIEIIGTTDVSDSNKFEEFDTTYVATFQIDGDIYVFTTDEKIMSQVGNYTKRNCYQDYDNNHSLSD